MSLNLGTYALVSALAVGGAVAQHQYRHPAGPPENDATAQEQTQQDNQTPQNNQSGDTSTPTGTTSTSGVLDCSTLMTHHQEMTAELDKLDQRANDQLTQMKEASSDRAKLDATMGVVETLVTQRKQMRDAMTKTLHESLQFMMSNNGSDPKTSCPQLTQWLQQGSSNGVNTDQAQPEQGGPNDMELQR
jgi:hypothetical protein